MEQHPFSRWTPRTDFSGSLALAFDFPGVSIGVAEYEEGPTGCTVVAFDRPRRTSIDVQGGWPATIGGHEYNRAIVMAGGSIYGLEAQAGVVAELTSTAAASPPGDPTSRFQPVSGAIIYDFGSTRRDASIYLDYFIGRAAASTLREGWFPLGSRGGARCARIGSLLFQQSEPGGQSAAFREMGGVKVLVCTVVNALGGIVDREGRVVRGNRHPETGERLRILPEVERRLAGGSAPPTLPRPPIFRSQHTTLTTVITNAKMDQAALRQFGRQVHSSMARAIEPFHSILDGDVLYAVTTDEVDAPIPSEMLAVLAREVAWDAVLAAAEHADEHADSA